MSLVYTCTQYLKELKFIIKSKFKLNQDDRLFISFSFALRNVYISTLLTIFIDLIVAVAFATLHLDNFLRLLWPVVHCWILHKIK